MIQVESRRTFMHGFVLTEPELRRIVESITEQFQKLHAQNAPVVTYTMTFRNGVIANTDSLDDVLSQENAGSGQIVRLRIEIEDRAPERIYPRADTSVMLEFVDTDAEDEPRSVSVRFLIRGKSRDWVFVTSTILEERVTKIKRFAFNQGGSKGLWRPLLPILLALGFFGGTFWSIRGLRGTTSSALEEAWRSGKLKDPVEAIIMAEKLRDHAMSRTFATLGFYMPIVVMLGIVLILVLVGGFIQRYFPAYNFCWGDYLEAFQRKESQRKFILVVIVLGILVSLVGSILANVLHRSP